MKNKSTLIIIIVAVLVVIVAVVSSYNGFVSMEESVSEASSAVSTQLQRRADLIPNFVETVKGYSDYEQSTLTAVTEARSKVGKASTVAEQESAQNELDSAISVWVNAVTEAYPDLKADKNYLALQDELAGTENRIAVARKDYNSVAKKYNVKIRRFPGNIFAGIFGFHGVEYFEASEGAQNVPNVSFK